MAYGAKYLIRFSDVYQNTAGQYEALIYKKDYTGPIYELLCGSDPLIIETDREGDSSYRPIIGSVATVNLLFRGGSLKYWDEVSENWNDYTGTWDSDYFDFTEFLNADIDTFYLEVQKNSSTFWKGYYVLTSDVTFKEIDPVDFSMQFSDLSLMKSTPYYALGATQTVGFDAAEKTTLKELFTTSLGSANLFNEYRINFPYTFCQDDGAISNEGTLSDTTVTFDQMYILKNAFLRDLGNYSTYYDVLYGLCSQFGLMMYQKNGYLYISSYDQLINESSRVYKRYNSSGTYIADVTETDSPIALNTANYRNIGRTQLVRYSLPYKYLDIVSSPSKATNNYNAYLWGFDKTVNPSVLALSGWKKIGSGLAPTRSVYKTSATSPYNYKFGLKYIANSTDFNSGKYLENVDGVQVNAGDRLSSSFKYFVDASSSYDAEETPCVAAIILTYQDSAGTEKTLYLSNASTPSWTSSFTTMFNTYTPGITGGYFDVKDISIPYTGSVKIRVYNPFNADWVIGNNNYFVFIKYAMVQTYKGENRVDVPDNTIYRSSYNVPFNNKETLVLNSNAYLFSGSEYRTYANETIDKAVSAVIGNCLLTEDYDYIDNSFVYGGATQVQTLVGEGIQRNIGLLNTAIEGTYKFADVYGIGQKFTYSITGEGSKSFCLLDYRMSLKNAEQDAIIYSCEFTSTTGLTLTTKTVTD